MAHCFFDVRLDALKKSYAELATDSSIKDRGIARIIGIALRNLDHKISHAKSSEYLKEVLKQYDQRLFEIASLYMGNSQTFVKLHNKIIQATLG